jgi:hypothetical protein
MSHFAEIDNNNKVIRVVVGDNNDPAGDEGYQWLLDNLGGTWIKTSFNGTIRKRFASTQMFYNPEFDIFIEPQPAPSWTINPDLLDWEAPVPYPTDGKSYFWNEETLSWDVIDEASSK